MFEELKWLGNDRHIAVIICTLCETIQVRYLKYTSITFISADDLNNLSAYHIIILIIIMWTVSPY